MLMADRPPKRWVLIVLEIVRLVAATLAGFFGGAS